MHVHVYLCIDMYVYIHIQLYTYIHSKESDATRYFASRLDICISSASLRPSRAVHA